MEENNSPQADARGAAQAADLLVTVAATLNERLALTAQELARSQTLLARSVGRIDDGLSRCRRPARCRAEDDVAESPTPKNIEYEVVLDHLYRAVQHLQSHDLVNQLIDAQKLRVDKMREKLGEAISLSKPPVSDPGQAEQWIQRSRAMLDCIVAGIQQIDDDASHPSSDKKHAGSVDLF